MFSKVLKVFVCGVLVIFGVLAIHIVVYAEQDLPNAPGWRFDEAVPMEILKKMYGSDQNPNPLTNKQKIIGSWGYGARNVDEIKDLLLPAFYNVLKHPEIWGHIRINETAYMKPRGKYWEIYQKATEKYKGACRLDKDGWLHDYVAGCPFPDVDVDNDPQAGVKLVWNFQKRFIYDDERSAGGQFVKDRSGNVRKIFLERIWLQFFNRKAVDPKPVYKPNPLGLDYAYGFGYLQPYNLRGTIPMYYRYIDNKPDDMWMYIPAMRRVRRMSTAQKQDRLPGGMDFTWDTNDCFGGNVSDFNVAYLGRKELLVPLMTKAQAQYDVNGYFSGQDQYYQRVNCYVVKLTYKKPVTMTDIYLYLDPVEFRSTFSIDTDIKGQEWMIQIYCWMRDKEWIPHQMCQSAVDLQRRHGTPAPCCFPDLNIGLTYEDILMKNLKKHYLSR